MIRALLLLVGWTPIAATGITINVLSRLKIVPQAIIDAWWSTGTAITIETSKHAVAIVGPDLLAISQVRQSTVSMETNLLDCVDSTCKRMQCCGVLR
jgi:hypothetical protein